MIFLIYYNIIINYNIYILYNKKIMSSAKLQYCGLHLHKDKFKTYYDLIKYYHLYLPCNSFQLFLNSPYTLNHDTTISESDTIDVAKYIKKNNIHLICHSGYLINLCSPKKKLVKLMIENISKDLDIIDGFGGLGVVIHFGKSVELTYQKALENYVKSCKKLILHMKNKKMRCKLIVETSAAQGTTICNSLEQVKEFYDMFSVAEKKYIGFCIDSCHIYQAGYDIRKESIVKNYFKKFDKYIGKDKLICFHINDSKNPFDDGVDRHENIFTGTIGANLKYFIKAASKYKLPMILETPDKDVKELNKLKAIIQ